MSMKKKNSENVVCLKMLMKKNNSENVGWLKMSLSWW